MLNGTLNSDGSPTDLSLLYGDAYLHAVTRYLAEQSGAKHVFIGDLMPPDKRRVKALHFWAGGEYMDGYEYDLDNTPCDNVVGQETCSYPQHVQNLFPLDDDLKTFNIESYCA